MTARGRLVTVAAALVLLGGGAVGCGDDSSSSPPPEGGGEANEMPRQKVAPPPQGSGEPSEDGSTRERGATAAHEDSGGGSKQFVVPGGDNSVQEFGAEAEGTEFEQAAAVLHAFFDARAAGDWSQACARLAVDVTESIEQLATGSPQLRGKQCPELLATVSGPATKEAGREAAIADVGALRVEGDRGFVLYHGVGDIPYAIPMRREDGEWKVAALAGVPLA